MRRTHKLRNRVFLYTVIICLACFSNFQAKGLSQPGESFTLKANNIALTEVFKNIYKQTRLKVTYSNIIFNDREKVNVDFSKTPMRDVMTFLLKGKDVNFEFAENLIIISKKETSNVSPADTLINVIPSVTGEVTDGAGMPVPGATVVVKGTQQGTTTDANGKFYLIDVERNSVILISSIGFKTREFILKGNSILVKLNMAVNELDETVVKGYYSTTKSLNTGSVSSINSKVIEEQPVNNPLLALPGRMPGVFVTQNTGIAGGGINIQIRGTNSIGNGNDPLYLIDGVPYSSQMLPNLANGILQPSNGRGGGGNPLSFISPNEIESISILKDADATAIYGSRGANGVVLITTKKGKVEKSAININVSRGVGNVSNKVKLLNTPQYLMMRREAFDNDGVIPTLDNAPDLLRWDTSRYTDWQKELIGKTADYTDVQASMSGGTPNVQYILGASFHKETTVFPGDFGNEKISGYFNVTSVSPNGKLKANLSTHYLTDQNKLPTADLTTLISLPPDAPEIFNPDGSLNWANSTWPSNNPIALTKRVYDANTANLVTNMALNYSLSKGLEIKSSFGYTRTNIKEISTTPIASLDPNAANPTGSASFTTNDIESWIIEPQLSYQSEFGSGKLEALIGTTFQKSNMQGSILDVSGYTSDDLLKNIQGGPNRTIKSATYSTYKYNAVFGRIGYNLDSRYILNLTVRRDGSSRFGNKNRFHTFGSIGAGWIFTNENFLQGISDLLNFGKLRASYGTTGNDQINDYKYYDLFNANSYSYQGVVGLTPASLSNPYLQWEKTKKFEAAVELQLLGNKLGIDISHYKNSSSNQLLAYSLSSITGFDFVLRNFPATVRNTGWEFTLNMNIVNSKKVKWTSSVNLTIPKNRLVSFPNIENSSYKALYVVGQPITIAKLFQLAGVNDTTGAYQFADSKGGYINIPDYLNDRTANISRDPKFYGGISNELVYKGFSFGFTLQFVKQSGVSYLLGPKSPGFINNIPVEVFEERWRTPGDKSKYQRLTQSYSSNAYLPYYFATQSNYSIVDASFIRLKNLSLTYQFDNRLLKDLKMANCKIYVRAQNLLTITGYNGLDPENSSPLAILPPLRIVTIGASATF